MREVAQDAPMSHASTDFAFTSNDAAAVSSYRNNYGFSQRAFTLVEVIFVIVILAILSALAIPKFVNLGKEARVAAVDSLGSALRIADAQIYAASVLKGTAGTSYSSYPDGTTNASGTSNVRLWCGHPDVQWDGIGNSVQGANVVWGTGYQQATQYQYGDFRFFKTSESGKQKAVWELTTATNPATCKVEYVYQPGSIPCPTIAVEPLIRSTTTGC
jgi:MSHA pilin protein MshA